MEISLTKKIKADPSFVFDWWTDLSPDDSKLVKPLKSRTVLSRSPERILLRDEEEMYFKKMSFDVVVTLHRPNSWTAEYRGASATARSEYRLKSEMDNTTTLVYKSRIEPTGSVTRLFSPIVEYFVKRVFAGEMETFVDTLERDFASKQMNRLDEK